jgi:spore maturation protein CgeB
MNRDVYTRRCFEIPGLGKLLLCERTSEMQELFKEDQEAVFFSNKQELLKKIEWLLANPSKIEQIAEAGHRRVFQDGHDIKSRSIEILNNL